MEYSAGGCGRGVLARHMLESVLEYAQNTKSGFVGQDRSWACTHYPSIAGLYRISTVVLCEY